MQPPPKGGGKPAEEGAAGHGWGPLTLGRFAPFVRGTEPALSPRSF
jgi:hypothetical protein